MTSRMTPLLEHNEQFARAFTPVPLGLPAAQVIVVTCLDHRVDPAITLGLKLGDAPVMRNAGGARHRARRRGDRLPRLPRPQAGRRAGGRR